MLASCILGGVVAAGTDPGPPAETAVGSSDAVDASAPDPSATDGGAFDIPGGVEPEILQEGTWFDSEGRLYFPEATTQSDEKNAAFCSFLFGTPDEVADVLGLDELAWAEESGLVNLGGGGTGYSCGLVPADSDDALVLSSEAASADTGGAAGDTSMTESSSDTTTESSSDTTTESSSDATTGDDDEVRPLVVFALLSQPLDVDGTPEGYAEFFQLEGGEDADSGALALSNEFDGEPIDAEFAEAWLTTARDRTA